MAVELTAIRIGAASAARPLLVLHGLFGSANNWRPIARKLGDHREIYLLNLRNHGSSPHVSEMTYPAMAGDVVQFVQDNSLGTVDLLGHSMGGKTAMTVALMDPELVDRLVVIDTAPVRYEKLNFSLLPALLQMDLSSIRSRGDADARLSAAVPNTRLRSFLLTNLVRNGDRFSWRVNLKAIEEHLGDLLGFPELHGTFAGPALFVAGERSEYRVDEQAAEICRCFPAARIERIANAGHWTHGDQPELTLAAIERFLMEGRS